MKQTRKKQLEANDDRATSAAEIRGLLRDLVEGLKSGGKGTFGDYIRLKQLLDEIEMDEISEVRVEWVDSLTDE